jgi:hypothetical protein
MAANSIDDSDGDMHYPSSGDESADLTMTKSLSSPEANRVVVHVDVVLSC